MLPYIYAKELLQPKNFSNISSGLPANEYPPINSILQNNKFLIKKLHPSSKKPSFNFSSPYKS